MTFRRKRRSSYTSAFGEEVSIPRIVLSLDLLGATMVFGCRGANRII